MFTKLKLSIAGNFLRSLLISLSTDNNTKTTVAGLLAGAILAIRGLDLAALLAGDPRQIALVVSSLSVSLIGYLAAKENHDGHTTILGVVAMAAQAFIGNFTSALALGLCGYFTNKTVTPGAMQGVPLPGFGLQQGVVMTIPGQTTGNTNMVQTIKPGA